MHKFIFCLCLFSIGIYTDAQCESFSMTLDITHPTCYNYSDGNIDVFTTGGTLPINGTITNENGIVVDNGKKTFSLIGGGWYYIYVVDANGCELYDSVYLINPPQMIALMTITDPSYTGACDGTALVDTVLNYQGSYTNIGYFWSPGGPYGIGENIKTNLCDTNYNIVINDEIGCNIIEYMAVGSVSVSKYESLIQLFPNPTAKSISICTENTIDGITLTDFSGRSVLILSGIKKRDLVLNLENFPAGIYFCTITFENGDYLQKKIVKRER